MEVKSCEFWLPANHRRNYLVDYCPYLLYTLGALAKSSHLQFDTFESGEGGKEVITAEVRHMSHLSIPGYAPLAGQVVYVIQLSVSDFSDVPNNGINNCKFL